MDLLRIDCREISGEPAKSEQIQRAYDCLTRHGYAILDHVLPGEKMGALKAEFEARHARYLENREYDETLEVGTGRFLVPVALSGPFADPELYANPFIMAMVHQALDTDAVLDNFGAIVSHAGAEKQHFHRDASPLFDSAIAAMLPAHALTVALPLVDMNEEHGTTAIWPGSHRWKSENHRDEKVQPLAPTIPVGSAFMWDYRLFHNGTPNVSPRARPMIYGSYARSWYRDAANFKKRTQRRLWYDDAFLETVPRPNRRLFARVL
ncbi:MAG TPA: phytanoyl-CoA dioxygenase family protein [Reyranella sp.]|nr:phytanoyl-CoA dioxygenase family protein [Reyranella sp.]